MMVFSHSQSHRPNTATQLPLSYLLAVHSYLSFTITTDSIVTFCLIKVNKTFGALNICSLTRKIDDVKALLYRSDLDFLGLSESWLNSSISDDEIEINGYNTHRFDHDLG